MSMGKKRTRILCVSLIFEIQDTPYPEVINIGFLDKFVPRCSKHLAEGFMHHCTSPPSVTTQQNPSRPWKPLPDQWRQNNPRWKIPRHRRWAGGRFWLRTRGPNIPETRKGWEGKRVVLLSFKSDWNYVFDILLYEIAECGPWTRLWNLHPSFENKDSWNVLPNSHGWKTQLQGRFFCLDFARRKRSQVLHQFNMPIQQQKSHESQIQIIHQEK